MTDLRADIPTPPLRMSKLPLDRRGYPVPRFVAWFRDGKEMNEGYGEPDFRVVGSGWLLKCIQFDLCWLCGEKLGKHKTFVVGPMCVVNRTSGEPPCHHECAEYAARACPFMTKPSRPRNEKGLPADGAMNPNGLARNPGATALYVTFGYRWLNQHGVIRMNAPERVEWWAQGRTATRAEIEHSISTGLPLLRKVAEDEGPSAVRALEKMTADAQHLLPSD